MTPEQLQHAVDFILASKPVQARVTRCRDVLLHSGETDPEVLGRCRGVLDIVSFLQTLPDKARHLTELHRVDGAQPSHDEQPMWPSHN